MLSEIPCSDNLLDNLLWIILSYEFLNQWIIHIWYIFYFFLVHILFALILLNSIQYHMTLLTQFVYLIIIFLIISSLILISIPDSIIFINVLDMAIGHILSIFPTVFPFLFK